MTRTPPAITVDRHVGLGNLLKDVYDELNDITYNSGANDLIVCRAERAAVAVKRLLIALEHDLLTSVPIEMDPRFIRKRVYFGDDRFAHDPSDTRPDAFANWREAR
jgi:hypothetical protein